MNYQKLTENNTYRKVTVFKIILYLLILFLVIISMLSLLYNIIYLSSEWELKVNTTNTQAKSTNLSIEEVGHSAMVPLRKSTCRPTKVIRNYDSDFPDAFDWRSKGVVGGVINQRFCNACWAISILGVMESMVAIVQIARGDFHGVTTLSVQQMIDCSYRKGCIFGDPRSAVETMMENNMSIVTEREYPLTLKQEACKIPENVRPKGVMIKDFEVDCNVTPEVMMSLIYHHGPVVVAVNSIDWLAYNDGIITRNCPNTIPSNHVVQIVGYDRSGEIPYYIVKNSWGTDFGIGGYLKVKMGENLCGIEEYVTSIDVRTYG